MADRNTLLRHHADRLAAEQEQREAEGRMVAVALMALFVCACGLLWVGVYVATEVLDGRTEVASGSR